MKETKNQCVGRLGSGTHPSRATKRRGGETKIVISKYTVFVPTVTHGLKIQNLE